MRNYLLAIGLIIIHINSFGQDTYTNLNAEQEMMEVTKILEDESILDSLCNQAIQNSNLLKAINQEMIMYEEEILQKKRLWYSSFRFGVNIFSANTTINSNDQSQTTLGFLPTLGITMTIDPEKLANRGSYIRQSESKRQYSAYMHAETRQDIKGEIRNMYFDYLSMLETTHLRKQALDTRLQWEQYVENQVKIGQNTYDQLLSISNQVYLASEAYVSAKISATKKKNEIEVLIGNK